MSKSSIPTFLPIYISQEMDRYSLQESIGADNEETTTSFSDDEAKVKIF